MKTLAECIKQYEIPKAEADLLTKKAAFYMENGRSQKTAEEWAVKEFIASLGKEEAAIVRQVEEKTPITAEVMPKEEPAVKTETAEKKEPVVVPEKQAPAIPVKLEDATIQDIPGDLEITTTAVHGTTGKKFRLKENAREAFSRIKAEIESIKAVMKCLG